MAKELLKGNVAFAEAAIRAGCEAYFGYPITPQTEALEHMSKRMPELGRVFLQAESEVAAINMVYGAACAGVRVMSSSSSPGVSLMMEGLSYIAGSELPVVLVDVMRGGPGLGNIAPSQGDYNQIVKGGGHGDYRPIVLAPASIQEFIDLTVEAFDIAEKYRCIVIILADGSLGQMMEPAELPEMRDVRPVEKRPAWALSGAKDRAPNVISSFYLDPLKEEEINRKLMAKQTEIEANEIRFRELLIEDAEIVVIAFGTAGRIAQSAIKTAREEGIRVGLLRPISLYPFPYDRVRQLGDQVQEILVVEMNSGQMLGDVRIGIEGRVPISFYGRQGGVVPMPDEVLEEIRKVHSKSGAST
ncbi:MAG: 2-ketoisovalerate ferredoxin oxidoreductase [Anaerolineae bacterium SM23_ 63]|nr:MAG: 2-ketoisovalerate ferredoxin oxidoreductase [Anaerolineae bacterium SM23_ 63]HEY46903.1 3-methyl-2-oxobutanoate dehydrogenase subunit VorB [Anaerolineae bacterium]